MTCPLCLNTGWVCESHFGRPWEGPGACGCGDSGVACSCNLGGDVDFDVVYAAVDSEDGNKCY